MAGDIIPLVRVKLLPAYGIERPVPARLQPLDKALPKALEMRRLGPSRIAALTCDGVAPLHPFKPAHRQRRALKMRLFRQFKLFTEMKQASRPPAPLERAGRRTLGALGKFR